MTGALAVVKTGFYGVMGACVMACVGCLLMVVGLIAMALYAAWWLFTIPARVIR